MYHIGCVCQEEGSHSLRFCQFGRGGSWRLTAIMRGEVGDEKTYGKREINRMVGEDWEAWRRVW
ncbi:hypothetical protein C2W62_02065 [Candidatus Entotheonella serta]|nr:hypothetical protein C2W62_02065 [Candidatus Entotheonella serta]